MKRGGPNPCEFQSDARINAELRAKACLLSPLDLESIREELRLNRHQMAEELGVSEAMLLGWETGAIIQPRAADKQMRQYRLSFIHGSNAELG